MSNKTPAYVAVCIRIQEFCAEHGVKLMPQAQVIDGQPGNKGWANFQIADTGHKIYVPRDQDGVGALHTTVAVPAGTPGKVSHLRERDGRDLRPGKIESFFAPDRSTLDNLLHLWAGTTDRLRDAKTPVRRGAPQQAAQAASEPEALPEVTAGVGA